METRIATLVKEMLEGDRVALARVLSLIESVRIEDIPARIALLRSLPEAPPKAYRIGFTGAPGAGKSSLIDSLGAYVLEKYPKARLAVLTVDPSSWRSGGSLLADQTRMRRLSGHPRSFARTFASGGHLGGLHPRIYEALLLCEAAGFDYIFIESVGTGQSEIELRYACDFLLYVALPYAGDEVQGLKRGLMEALDGVALNKSDTVPAQDLNRARFQLESALQFLRSGEERQPFVEPVSALTGSGIEKLWNLLQAAQLSEEDLLKQRQQQTRYWIGKYWEDALEKWLAQSPYGKLRHQLFEQLDKGAPLWKLLEDLSRAFGLLT